MKRALLALAMLALPLAAQPAPDRVQKVIQLKYADANSVAGILGIFTLDIRLDNNMKIIALSGPADRVSAAEAAIKQLDIAPKNVELAVYFVTGSDKENPAGNAVPHDLEPVITQLKTAFAFKNYRLLDVLSIRARTGSGADTSGVLGTQTTPQTTQFGIRSVTIGDDGTIRIERLHAAVRIPINLGGKTEYTNTGVDQNVDIKEGQKVVVGRTSLEGPDKALFLVLTAKVVP
jgi:hypothetical protein